MASTSPKNITVRGRLSFPTFSYQEAVAKNSKSQYAKDAADVSPDFNLLLEQGQMEKVKKHLLDVFLPYCVEQYNKGEKRDALDQKQADKIIKIVEAEDWEDQPPYLFVKPVPEKTQALAPETVAMVKVLGMKGQDIEQRAIVTDESELAVPDPDQLTFPIIRPIGQTVHSLYAGCVAVATINLYAYVSGKLPGIGAGAGVVVFKADADRFGGGMALDEEAVFLDD